MKLARMTPVTLKNWMVVEPFRQVLSLKYPAEVEYAQLTVSAADSCRKANRKINEGKEEKQGREEKNEIEHVWWSEEIQACDGNSAWLAERGDRHAWRTRISDNELSGKHLTV